MSTKNLARTVIEGGRYRRNRWDRHHSNKTARRAEQQLSNRLPYLDATDSVSYAPRERVYRMFRDKLSPAIRWMRSQVGRPWNKVRGELMERFDTRTTAGRHIVFDHLLRDVRTVRTDPVFRSHYRFEVDRHGYLREAKPDWFRRKPLPRLPEPEDLLLEWLAGRRVGDRGGRLYWFVPTESGAFRQHLLVDDESAVRWRSLPEWFRERWAMVGLG